MRRPPRCDWPGRCGAGRHAPCTDRNAMEERCLAGLTTQPGRLRYPIGVDVSAKKLRGYRSFVEWAEHQGPPGTTSAPACRPYPPRSAGIHAGIFPRRACVPAHSCFPPAGTAYRLILRVSRPELTPPAFLQPLAFSCSFLHLLQHYNFSNQSPVDHDTTSGSNTESSGPAV